MATLKDIRKRIGTVKNTQKITRAMKMVAAAKLRRAQQNLLAARPHGELVQESLRRFLGATDRWNHPLVAAPEQAKKAHLLILTSDRGLCGGFNGNLLRFVDHFLRHEGKDFEEVELSVIGRKGRDFYRAKGTEVAETTSLDLETFDFSASQALAKQWIERYQKGEFEVLYLAYNSFKSAISQVPTLKRVLPLEVEGPQEEAVPPPMEWEGPADQIEEALISRNLSTVFFLAARESLASELGARMSAMENATNNASEMIGTLTLQYNRARQAAITLELMDIVNGAEAL